MCIRDSYRPTTFTSYLINRILLIEIIHHLRSSIVALGIGIKLQTNDREEISEIVRVVPYPYRPRPVLIVKQQESSCNFIVHSLNFCVLPFVKRVFIIVPIAVIILMSV